MTVDWSQLSKKMQIVSVTQGKYFFANHCHNEFKHPG